ncbi:MAG: radical SAM protein [Candidatus Bipolaricaulaceae bacterium]
MDLVFGPVPSRRLGRSLGINHIRPKVCTYSCVYCQLGRTLEMAGQRQRFYRPEQVVQAASEAVADLRRRGDRVDYLTLVPDGEPTLDVNLGREIACLKQLGIPVAVISNASLVDRPDVRADLAQADWVSLKVDAARQSVWRRVNRPHREISLAAVRAGMVEFAREFSGTLTTETMLVGGVNDGPEELAAVADFLAAVRPAVAYLAVPTRPPAESWVEPPQEEAVAAAYQAVSEHLPRVELLIGYEGDAFAASGDAAHDLLSITAVHPMREQAVKEVLARDAAEWDVVRRLVACGQLVELSYRGSKYYLRRLGRGGSREPRLRLEGGTTDVQRWRRWRPPGPNQAGAG